MASATAQTEEQQILDSLRAHGFHPADYIKLKQLVNFDFPLYSVSFYRRFGTRTIQQVFEQVAHSRQFLERDFVLPADQRADIEKALSGIELIAWNALLESNSLRIGPWILCRDHIPSGIDTDGQPEYLPPSLKLTAVHSGTEEKREVVVPGKEYCNPVRWSGALKGAFETLGIYDLLKKGPVSKRLVSARHPRGWPLYTQFIIPTLYERLLPFYNQPGHSSEASGPTKARFPKELLEIMLQILRLEDPQAFDDAAVSQLAAVVQRHLDRKQRQITKSRE